MEIEAIKKLLKKYMAGHSRFIGYCRKAENYYRNKTDILFEKNDETSEETSPLRNADNRIPFNFHGLLVNQKASYIFTEPPVFDIGSEESNKRLVNVLGERFSKTCKDLCINASNNSIAWLHIYRNEEGKWDYAVIPSAEIIPVWGNTLKRKLSGVFRNYGELEEETGEEYQIYEYWNDTTRQMYRVRKSDGIEELEPYMIISAEPSGAELLNEYNHEVGEVPFIPFFNNNIDTGDLDNIKALIDTYCKVFSGFVNDLEDIQEIIFILTNYGGQDLKEFLSDLKKYKAIKIESESGDDKSGVDTLTIQLPVEAREKLLTITRKCIFEQGQGIDPDPENFGNSSGVALKFLYSLLELKSGLMETEFRLSFDRVVRIMCKLNGLPIQDDIVNQVWTRTTINSDDELANIARNSEGVISQKTIVRNHPWVTNPEAELEELQKEKDSMIEYQDTFTVNNPEEGEPKGAEGKSAGGNPKVE